MRGRPSVFARAGRLEAARARRPVRRPSSWNLDVLTDDELEALLPLAEQQAAAAAEGREPAWTTAEAALLERLWATQAGNTG